MRKILGPECWPHRMGEEKIKLKKESFEDQARQKWRKELDRKPCTKREKRKLCIFEQKELICVYKGYVHIHT